MRNLVLLLTILAFTSCRTTHMLQDDQYLVTKYKVKGASTRLTEENKLSLQPKTNRKLLGLFRLNLWLYLKANSGKENKSNWIIKNSFGEPPALLDTSVLNQNISRLNINMFNSGYFYSHSSYKIKLKKRKKKAKIIYSILPGDAYHINKIYYPSDEREIDNLIQSIRPKSLLHPGDNYNLQILNNERDRITYFLKQRGYYFFSKEYILVNVDSSNSAIPAHTVDLYFLLKPAKQEYVYQPFTLDSIKINTDYSLFQNSSKINYKPIGNYYINIGKKVVNDQVIVRNLTIAPHDLFSDQQLQISQSRINSLNLFNYVNFKLTPIITDTTKNLKVDLSLTPGSKRDLRFDAEGNTNNGNTLGIIGSVFFRDKNLWGGAEYLELGISGGIESQQSNLSNEANQSNFFNTFEYSLNASLNFPKIIFSKTLANRLNVQSAKTKIAFNYYRQYRYDYDRSILNSSFGYEWQNTKNSRFGFYPFEVNLGKTPSISKNLETILSQLNDPFLLFSFSNHLTTSTRFSYIYSNADLSRKINFARFSIESAGNILNTLKSLVPNANTDSLFGLPYFQYLRFDSDIRKYIRLKNDGNIIAYRLFLGLGFPLNGIGTLPLEKRYFIGGANSLRAWQARSLGPGSYVQDPTRSIDQFGEIKIETNLEYRFRISKYFKGAIFTDIGNIWTLNESLENRQNALFNFQSFYKDLAIGTGFGLRYDFTYFLLRLDTGIKLKDPASQEKWVFSTLNSYNSVKKITNLNLAIGYPF